MVNIVNLTKTASSWQFDSEEALEDFVWANLSPLFSLTPLKRQHIVKGQFCDETPPPSDAEIEVMLQKRLEEKYL